MGYQKSGPPRQISQLLGNEQTNMEQVCRQPCRWAANVVIFGLHAPRLLDFSSHIVSLSYIFADNEKSSLHQVSLKSAPT